MQSNSWYLQFMYKVYSLLPMFTRLQYNLYKVSQHNISQYSTRLQYNTMQNKVTILHNNNNNVNNK